MTLTGINADDEKLIEAARQTLRKRYRPGRHGVAAAVLCESGRIYTGINIEACAYAPCAEPIAIGAALTAGDDELRAIVAVHKTGDGCEVISPCGNCRQLLVDYAPEALVIYAEDGGLRKTEARNLLPGAFRLNFD